MDWRLIRISAWDGNGIPSVATAVTLSVAGQIKGFPAIYSRHNFCPLTMICSLAGIPAATIFPNATILCCFLIHTVLIIRNTTK